MNPAVLCPNCNASCPAHSDREDGRMICPECKHDYTDFVASLPTTVVDPNVNASVGPRPNTDSLLGQTLGGCRIESHLGQGGMGIVFKGHHEALDIPIALKVLPA